MNRLHASRSSCNLEAKRGVHIGDDARPFAVQLLQKYDDEPSLKNKEARHLVVEACKEFELNREEGLLDWDEYCLDRAFVEVTELRREKSVSCRTDILPRVEKELAELTRKWDCFRNKWFKVIQQQKHDSRKRPELLGLLRDELHRFMTTIRASKLADAEDILELPPLLNNYVDHLQHTIHSAFMEKVTVGTREVAQAASKLSGLPEKCFNPPFDLRMALQIEDIRAKLSEKLIALDGVIHKIGRGLSKQKSVGGPLGSFLLLGPYGCGRTRLAEALAEEIYGDKERFIVLDMSLLHEPHLATKILHRLTRLKKNGHVVLFKDIDNVHICTNMILPQIIRDGILGDDKDSVSFFNDIILVTSHVGNEVFLDCECLHNTIPFLPFREILSNPALLHEGITTNNCRLQQFCTEVKNQFNSEFLKLFNDLVVFPFLSMQNHIAICRLQLRDVAESMSVLLDKKVILYPSDASVVNMMNHDDIIEIGAHAYEDWYDLHMMPMLDEHALENESGDILIIYIDQLVGLGKEFSFRVENGRHLEKFPAHKRFKESLSSLRSIYRREKLQSYNIMRLKEICSSVCDLIRMKPEGYIHYAHSESMEALKLIDCLKLEDDNEVQLDYYISEAEASVKLQSSLKQRDKATQDIIEPLLRRLQISNDEQSEAPTASLLCLGLTPKSKNHFAGSLGKQFLVNEGEQLLVQVDLSQCREPGSFFQCCTYTGLLLTEAVNRIPISVVMFHQLEMAHMSVFSTILSILESGVAVDSEGKTTSYKKCTVIIISDLGNKEIISRLMKDKGAVEMEMCGGEGEVEMEAVQFPVERQLVEIVKDDASKSSSSTSPKGLRYELLYRLDQLLLFDPFSDNQLNRYAMLPMKPLEEKAHRWYKAFSDLFNVECAEKNLDEIMEHIRGAVGEVMEIRRS